jgi:hypothetical protein
VDLNFLYKTVTTSSAGMPIIVLVFTDAGHRTTCIDALPAVGQMPLGLVSCNQHTYANFSTRPPSAVAQPLGSDHIEAAHLSAQTRPHAHRPLAGQVDRMPDTVIFPPALEMALATHLTFDRSRFRELEAMRGQLERTNLDSEWFVACFKKPATAPNIQTATQSVHVEHAKCTRALAAWEAVVAAFYDRHIVCTTRGLAGRPTLTLSSHGGPTRLRCKRTIGPYNRDDVITTNQPCELAGWPLAGLGTHRITAPASMVEELVHVTDLYGLTSWVNASSLGPPQDTSFRVGPLEVVWWLFGPGLTCSVKDATVCTTMTALLATGLGKDMVASRSIGHGGVGRLAAGGIVTFTEQHLLQIGRACFVKRWSQLIPSALAKHAPQPGAASAPRGHPPCMTSNALSMLPSLNYEFRRDIASILVSMALARGVPVADVLPPGFWPAMEARFPQHSCSDLKAELQHGMKKGAIAPSTRCCNRRGHTARVPCQMSSPHACAAIMDRQLGGGEETITPAGMAAGGTAIAAPQVETSARYHIRMVHLEPGQITSEQATCGFASW